MITLIQRLAQTVGTYAHVPTVSHSTPDLVAWLLRPFLPRRFWYRRLYLRTTHWRYRASQARIAADFRCQDCGCRRTRNRFIVLDAHHMNYDNLWHEEARDLMVLCRRCHDRRHGKSLKRERGEG